MNIEKFCEYIREPAASGNEEWVFADHEDCRERIHNLTQSEVEQIEQTGVYKVAAERVRSSLSRVQLLFENRGHALEMMVACAIARVNLVFLGPPGVAKSLMVRSFAETMGVRPDTRPIAEEDQHIEQAQIEPPRRRLFEYLLTRYTTPEELFGGIDIELMLKAGIHHRRSIGMLPHAEVAFLDEIFKANNAILNALLSITNERIFYNMGQAFRVDLAFVVGASNETPDQEELGALYDRFPIRVLCRPVDSGEMRSLIRKSHAFNSHQAPARVACLNDIRLLSRVVQDGVFGGIEAFKDNQFGDQFMDLLLSLRDEYSISDRTPALLLRVCRALGVLDSVQELTPRHLKCFGYIAQKMDGIHDLQRLVKSRVQHLDDSAVDLFADV